MSETTETPTFDDAGRPGGWRRSRRLRWAVPAGVVAVVVAALLVPMVASAAPKLAPKTPAELLAAVGGSGATPLSGTVVETARLGLPALPDTGRGSISLTSLVAGSNTLRVWYDGGERARLALIGDLAETDLIHNGTDAWLWTSGQNTAQHIALPARSTDATPSVGAQSLTPQQAASKALAAVDPTTKVSLGPTTTVAGRSAYQLVLAPRDARSLVGQVRIAVDADTSVPLRVSVYAAGSTGRPAFETGFTSVSFSRPSASVFRFTPPAGTKVSELGGPTSAKPTDSAKSGAVAAAKSRHAATAGAAAGEGTGPKVVGTGWTSVVELSGVSTATPAPATRHEGNQTGAQLGALMKAMTPVSGAYGSGRVLQTKLVSVLLLDDGRLFVGAVAPSVLEAAAAA